MTPDTVALLLIFSLVGLALTTVTYIVENVLGYGGDE